MSSLPPGQGSAPPSANGDPRRGPRVFRADDPALVETVAPPDPPSRDSPRAGSCGVVGFVERVALAHTEGSDDGEDRTHEEI